MVVVVEELGGGAVVHGGSEGEVAGCVVEGFEDVLGDLEVGFVRLALHRVNVCG